MGTRLCLTRRILKSKGLYYELNEPRSVLLCLTATRHVNSSSNTKPPKTVMNFDPPHVNSAALESGVTKYYCNRNPRSLELLGVAEKPRGFKTSRQRVDYYHRLMLDISSRHVSAYVNHNNGNKVVEASTKEFCISRYLYKTSDTAAAFNIGRVIAHRCKDTGLCRVMWEHKRDKENKKVKAFVSGLKNGGLILNEPKPRRKLPAPNTLPSY